MKFPPLHWPAFGPLQQPDSYIDYSYVATQETQGGLDPITSASLSVAPSGAGELQPGFLSASNTTVTAWMNGGVPGRVYQVRLELMTEAGRVFEVLIRMEIDRALMAWPPIEPPSLDFGPAITLVGSPLFDFASSGYIALLSGF